MLEGSEAHRKGSAREGRVAEAEATGTGRRLLVEHVMDHSKNLGFIPIYTGPKADWIGLDNSRLVRLNPKPDKEGQVLGRIYKN